MENLRLRAVSALIMIPLALGVVVAGGPLFDGIVLVAALLAAVEWSRMAAPGAIGRSVVLSGGGAVAVTLTALGCGLAPAVALALALTLVLALVPAAANSGLSLLDRRIIALSVPYVGLSGFSVLWLRNGAGVGAGLVLFLFLAIWANDSAAYAVGRAVGGPKLAPTISPKKTWAGFIGGTVAGALVGLLWAWGDGAREPLVGLGLGGLLAVVGQVGDLFESALKRQYNLKDSGQLIPGHGGLLDRIDGLMAAAPVLALFQATVGATLGWW